MARSPDTNASIRFLFIGPRLCLPLLSDPASRRRPWGLTILHLHQVGSGLTPEAFEHARHTTTRARWGEEQKETAFHGFRLQGWNTASQTPPVATYGGPVGAKTQALIGFQFSNLSTQVDNYAPWRRGTETPAKNLAAQRTPTQPTSTDTDSSHQPAVSISLASPKPSGTETSRR